MLITQRTSSGRIAKGSNLRHGLSDAPEYDCWVAMKARCLKSQHPMYKHYGARGIKVCAAWLESFDNFYADIGKRPDGLTLDRIDVNGDYEPTNCRWLSHARQQLNRRDNTSHPGVTLERGKYRADISVKGAKHFLGRYLTEIEAISARTKAELLYGI